MEQEIWKDVVGYEGYYKISNTGIIKSVPHFAKSNTGDYTFPVKERLIKAFIVKGYLHVGLTNASGRKSVKLHRVIAQTFIPNPEHKPCVNHKDGNKLNNSIENLEWCTAIENSRHAADSGLYKIRYGQRNHTSKIVLNTLTGIFYDSIREAALTTNFTRFHLRQMLAGLVSNKSNMICV